ncbi:MAG: AraC family transcriptional regulator [Flavobacterium sp.]|uniref:AraC family transcriptional regulator n=1 Tax=Flavobacterium sp. TaxID=239 RepID=UPI000C433330|nr:helix-turn-helix transcriptional regulator [Flavobacterium sp.]MBF04729.1 AraC family transcriptional regulator [Flavobacterium sp.]|tara:strand:+ start:912 stop:1784 length:873 start_codon:yes stop_codon:yes gene_type:complete
MRYPVYKIENFEETIFKNNFYVNSFANHLKKHRFIEDLHRHNFYLLVFFTHGNGVHSIDFKKYSIQKGSLFFMQPGQMHSWKLSDDIEGYIVFYTKEIFDLYFKSKSIESYSFFESFQDHSEILLSDDKRKLLEMYFKLMLEEKGNDQLYGKNKLINLLDIILIEIARCYEPKIESLNSNYNLKLKQFEALLEKHYKNEKAPSFYADKMAITLKHLNRITKATLDKTVTDVIAERLLLEGKRLLVERKLSVNQIADELGFASPNYFVKLFKKREGITTKAFVQKMKNHEL